VAGEAARGSAHGDGGNRRHGEPGAAGRHLVRPAQQGQSPGTQTVYRYLAGPRFRRRVEAIAGKTSQEIEGPELRVPEGPEDAVGLADQIASDVSDRARRIRSAGRFYNEPGLNTCQQAGYGRAGNGENP